MVSRPPSVPAASRLASIDVLRAVAVLLVLGRHAGAFWPRPEDLASPWTRPMAWWMSGGWVGVDLFFVLSGFLVSGLLFREHTRYGTVRAGHFLLRRGLKIYPAFYALLALHVASRALLGSPPHGNLVWEAIFVQNYLGGIWSHTWSLAVEEHFYLAIALGFALAVRLRQRSNPFAGLPWLCLFVAVASVLLRWRAASAGAGVTEIVFASHLRFDTLLLGVALAYLHHRRPEAFVAFSQRHRRTLLVAGLALMSPPFLVPIGTPWIHTLGLTMIALGAAALLCAALGGPTPTGHLGRTLAHVGTASYAIYLWHIPLRDQLLLLQTAFDLRWPPWLGMSIYLLVTTVLGIYLARWIEQPALRLRDRLLPTRATPLATR